MQSKPIITTKEKKALDEASRKLRKLRLTTVYGEKDIPAETVKSVFQAGLGGMYHDEAITYMLKFGIKYYLESCQPLSTDKECSCYCHCKHEGNHYSPYDHKDECEHCADKERTSSVQGSHEDKEESVQGEQTDDWEKRIDARISDFYHSGGTKETYDVLMHHIRNLLAKKEKEAYELGKSLAGQTKAKWYALGVRDGKKETASHILELLEAFPTGLFDSTPYLEELRRLVESKYQIERKKE